ncbi:Alpha-mannosidase 2x, partial [Orchesella cincta]
NMTFVWSEISFLSKWWDKASATQKQQFRRLLHEGRLEILTGGWVMSDEAVSSIFGLTNQMIEGHSWLKRNLNYKPKYSVSLDPFGQGSSMPYILKNSGIEGMMIQRLHFAWKHWLGEHKNGDFLWSQRFDSTGKHSIHCLNAHYDLYPTKHRHAFIIMSKINNILGNEHEEHLQYMTPVSSQNILHLADELMGQYRRTASLTSTTWLLQELETIFNLMNPLNGTNNIHNYDKLFQFINANPQRYNARVQFGTILRYFKAVKDSHVELPTFQGDFFPYSDTYFPYSPAYWVGYYGTRPFWKKLSREAEDELRKAEILFTFTLNHLRQQNHSSEAQHIQTISAKLLVQRQLQTYHSYTNAVGESFANLADQVPLKFPADGTTKKIVFFNSLGWTKSHLVRILVETPFVSVYGTSGEPVSSQINPKLGTTENGDSGIFDGYYELVFVAYLQPLAHYYEIQREEDRKRAKTAVTTSIVDQQSYITMENDEIAAYFDGKEGLLKGITRKAEQLTTKVNLTYGKYDTSFGSGAYLLRPHIDSKTNLLANCRNESGAQLYVVSGPVMQEVTDIQKPYRLFYLTNSVKPQGTKFGEFFMSFQTDLETREKSFNDDSLEPRKYVSCNKLCLYPRRTGGKTFLNFGGSSHGFTSTKSGQLEAIFDRRLPYDDARGMDEGVNDPEDMVSNYVLLLEPLLKVQGDKAWAPTLEIQRASKFLNFQPTAFVYDSIASDNKNMHRNCPIYQAVSG